MLPLSIGEVAVLGEMLIAEEFEGLWSDLVNTWDVNLTAFDVAGKESVDIVTPAPWAIVAQYCQVMAWCQKRSVISILS